MTSVVLTSETVEPTSLTAEKEKREYLLGKVSEEQRAHVADLVDFHKNNPPKPLPTVYLYTTLSYVNYVRRWIMNFVMTFVSNPSMPIFHPIDFLFMITVIPLFIIGMLIMELLLHAGEKLGLEEYTQKVTDNWGSHLTPVNWWDPRIFSPATKAIIDGAKQALNTPYQQTMDDSTDRTAGRFSSSLARSFNIDIAETLLLFSGIMYERNQPAMRKAHKLMAEITKNPAKATREHYENLGNILQDSERHIRCQAEEVWDVKFTSLSELNTFGGPFAGMFWCKKNNFIIVAFKGTTPSDYQDFLTDFTWQRTDARAYLFGDVHEGFYTSMFPSVNAARSNKASPYFTIAQALRDTSKEISAGKKEKVNVWVTGHSLGAALAGLFFTRLMHSPEDMGEHCELRDAYLFGMPRLGDDDWAAGYASLTNRPFDRHNTMWRVINGKDIVTKGPPGYNHPDSGRYISQQNMLNYTHVGEGIHFFGDGRVPISTRNIFSSSKDPVVIERNQESLITSIRNLFKRDEKPKVAIRKSSKVLFDGPYVHPKGSPIPFFERLMPTCIRDHMVTWYFYAIQNARAHFENESGNVSAIVPQAESNSKSKQA